jgi:alpha-ketoglutarate-dependent 2,4-dichlorophenoxyacetate dioxygenase
MTSRDVRRTTVVDDGPLAYGVSEQEKRDAGWQPSS